MPMKYQEVKRHHKNGGIKLHVLLDDSAMAVGEQRHYHEGGQSSWHFFRNGRKRLGEVKVFDCDGVVWFHYLTDDKGNDLASVIEHGEPHDHTEEQLIQIAKEHGLPLLSDLPKSEEEVTLWNLKWPDLPCLPIASE